MLATMVARWLPLCISIVFAVPIAILSFTPWAWNLAGRPAETYPELFYLILGVPPALILFVTSLAIAVLGTRERGGALRPTLRALWGGAAIAALATALVLSQGVVVLWASLCA